MNGCGCARAEELGLLGLLAFNGSQFNRPRLPYCTWGGPSLLPWRNSERERQVQPKAPYNISAYSTAIIGSYCRIFCSKPLDTYRLSHRLSARLRDQHYSPQLQRVFYNPHPFTRSLGSFSSLLQGSTTLPLVRAPTITPKLEWQQLLPLRPLRRSSLRRSL